MEQVVQLDATTLLIKSNDSNDLADIVDFISQKNKVSQQKNDKVCSFLEFAAQNKMLSKNYQFNREECYEQ